MFLLIFARDKDLDIYMLLALNLTRSNWIIGKTTDIADFYQQLALLTRSNLPLPDSIRQLAGSFNKSEFRDMLEHVSRDTASGIPLVIHFFTYEMAEPWIEKGVRLALFGTDRAGIADDMQADFKHLRGLP